MKKLFALLVLSGLAVVLMRVPQFREVFSLITADAPSVLPIPVGHISPGNR
ncbi:MAG: hypothetical protein PHG00_17860 [Methylococcales bacterium]|nr:hypothetical protein [Methylococcales bacterium]